MVQLVYTKRMDRVALGVDHIASSYDSTGAAATTEPGSVVAGSGNGRQALLRGGIRHRL